MANRYEKQISVSLESETVQALDALVELTRRKRSDLARECIERELPKLKDRERKRKKAREK
jgi:predicted DNA-binding protein